MISRSRYGIQTSAKHRSPNHRLLFATYAAACSVLRYVCIAARETQDIHLHCIVRVRFYCICCFTTLRCRSRRSRACFNLELNAVPLALCAHHTPPCFSSAVMSAKAKAPENLSRLQKALRRDQLWEKVRPCALFAEMCFPLNLPPKPSARLLFRIQHTACWLYTHPLI